MKNIYNRALSIDLPKNRSAFLWGPRKTGKTYWINKHFTDAIIIDLLKTDVFADYISRPSLLRERFQEHRGLKEEIAAEAVVQNIPAFAEFLRVAALTSGELLNYTNVGRETGVSAKVVKNYFQILEDTLLGFRVQPWRRVKTRRLIETEKFYLFDTGVADYLARRSPRMGPPEFGKSFLKACGQGNWDYDAMTRVIKIVIALMDGTQKSKRSVYLRFHQKWN